jgi:phosphoserine phosphatase
MTELTAHTLVMTGGRDGIASAAIGQACSMLASPETKRAEFPPNIDPLKVLRQWECLFEAPWDGPDGAGLGPLLRRIRAAENIDMWPIDVNIVALTDRRKRLLIADMESTIIEQEMLDELGDFIDQKGMGGARTRIEDITARAMRGELDFEAALDERVGLLKGLDAGVLDEVAERITLMPGAETLVRTMKANGAYCALVSGGFTVFTARIAKQLGFDEHRANVLEIEGGKLTGRVKRPILGREAKLAALRELTAKLKLRPSQTLAVGDGANDLAMLEAAGLGVAFRAKPKVQEAARGFANGAVITHGDLTALLALQGYDHPEFVA